jgi:cobalt-zinc-cadmium efflux system protein
MSTPEHTRRTGAARRELTVALLATVAMMGVELYVGWLTGSLALLADGWHMFADASALALSLFAAGVTMRPATPQKSYGYHRTEILGALANGIVLWLIVGWIFSQAFLRLRHPAAIQTGPMLLVALLGLAVNLIIGRLLAAHRRGNLNVQGAWLNVMSDALGSLGVIVAGLLVRWFDWAWADPLASAVIGALIGVNAWSLMIQSVNVLLEAAPARLRMEEVAAAMREVPGVLAVHDVHCWTITTGMDAMSGHVEIDAASRSREVLARLNALLSERFGIEHTTFQLEPRSS